ncbi:Fungalysin metallopeptidase-domain-containing protein [Kalaharituber pfeilii]|nr:Fungalysin metallopeptidase-domain-containing protein [Kalaharituber pfeilii]
MSSCLPQGRLIKDHYTDDDTGITHAYFIQTYDDIDIQNTQINLNVKRDGSILSPGTSFVTGDKGIIQKLGLPVNAKDAVVFPIDSFSGEDPGSFTLMGVEGVLSEPVIVQYRRRAQTHLEAGNRLKQARNFQELNTGSQGAGGDAVQLNAQEGNGFNNANFATPEDGRRPRMGMYFWNEGSPMRDDVRGVEISLWERSV